MKKSISLLFLTLCFISSAQQNKIEAGEFTATSSLTKGVKIIITGDNKYSLSVMSGTFEQINDSIVFHTESENNPKFDLKFVSSNSKSDKIKINFGEEMYLNLYKTYIGTQKTAQSAVEYKSLKEILNITDDNYYDRKQLDFEIDKVAYLFLVKEGYDSNSIIEKYEIPATTSEVQIKLNESNFSGLKLKGYYNSQTKELTVSEGKVPIVFALNKSEQTFIKPLKSLAIHDWSYPGKPVESDVASFVVDSAATTDYANETPKYNFKLKIEKSLEAAQKAISSYPNKLLVVFYDTDKNATNEFQKYIEDYQNNVQYLMYDKYNPEYDKVYFYLAQEKDKNNMKKIGITENQSVVFLNSDGTKLYHTKAKIFDGDYSYYSLKYLLEELEPINALAKMDKVLLAKNATTAQLESAFSEVVKFGKSKYAVTVPPPADSVKEKVIEEASDIKVVEAVADVDNYNDEVLKEKDNIYKLKATKAAVDAKYKQVLDAHSKDNAVNADLVKIICSELSTNSGFSSILFNEYDKKIEANDFQSIDYLLRFFDAIPKVDSLDNGTPYSSANLIEIISNALNRSSNASQFDKINDYYERLAKASYNNITVLKNKLSAIKEYGSPSQFLSAYDSYFKSVVKDDTNLIEQLDKVYNPEVDYSWSEFKNAFAYDANDAAWFVVEKVKENDSNILRNAIKWSETSLKIENNNHYYLDTLAQLYYRNGEKEKAITFEKKAIEIGAKDSSFDRIYEYIDVRNKMENGTY